jgi:hypothetical protein
LLVQVFIPSSALEGRDHLTIATLSDEEAAMMETHLGRSSVDHARRMGGTERFDEVVLLRSSLRLFFRATFLFSSLPDWIKQAPTYNFPAEYRDHERRIAVWFLAVVLELTLSPPTTVQPALRSPPS